MKKVMWFMVWVLTTSTLQADILPSIGRGLAWLQDEAQDLFRSSKSSVEDWWERDGRERFGDLGDHLIDIGKETWEYLKGFFAQINEGYQEYWDEEGIAEEDRPPVEEDGFLYSFLAWWEDQGEPAFGDMETGYRHFVENFDTYRSDYFTDASVDL